MSSPSPSQPSFGSSLYGQQNTSSIGTNISRSTPRTLGHKLFPVHELSLICLSLAGMSHLSIQQPPRNLPITGPSGGGQLTSPNRSGGGNILPQMGANNQRIGVLGQRAIGDKRPSVGYGPSMIGGSYFNLQASAPSGLGPAGLAGVRGAFQGLAHGQGSQSQGVQGLQMPFGMPMGRFWSNFYHCQINFHFLSSHINSGMDGSLAPPSLDLSEFPSLTNRSMGPNENGGSSSITGRSNYGRLMPDRCFWFQGYILYLLIYNSWDHQNTGLWDDRIYDEQWRLSGAARHAKQQRQQHIGGEWGGRGEQRESLQHVRNLLCCHQFQLESQQARASD